MGALRLTWGTQMLVLHHWDPWHLHWSWYKLWHCIPLAPGTAATHLGTHALGLLVPARHQLGWWPLTGVKTHWLVHNMIWTTMRIFVYTSKWVKIYIMYRCLQEQDQAPKIPDSVNTEKHFLAFSDCSSVSRISSPFRLAHWQISALLDIREASESKTAHLVVFNYQCIMYTPMFLGGVRCLAGACGCKSVSIRLKGAKPHTQVNFRWGGAEKTDGNWPT